MYLGFSYDSRDIAIIVLNIMRRFVCVTETKCIVLYGRSWIYKYYLGIV